MVISPASSYVQLQYSVDFRTILFTQDYNGTNLVNLHDTGDYKKYARSLLKFLFTPAEMSDSVLFENPNYARSGLDKSRMSLWKGTNEFS